MGFIMNLFKATKRIDNNKAIEIYDYTGVELNTGLQNPALLSYFYNKAFLTKHKTYYSNGEIIDIDCTDVVR